ncbi:MAG: terminase [Muribaculaceae bacterium]|nr:terminase [Muribaculaceae bacterium]
MDPEEILQENSRRITRLKAPYDPLAGSEPGKIDLARCHEDFAYWAATCCYIKNKKGGDDILFRLNYPQRKMVGLLEGMRREGKPIRLILLKARQWGGSTCAQLYMAWLQLMHKRGLNSLIIAHQHSATAEIRDMFMRMIESYPEEAMGECRVPSAENRMPKNVNCIKRRVENSGPGAFRVVEGNFKVKVGSAERPDSCRGGDYSLVHCSEVALWKKTRLKTPEDQMRAACSGVLLQPLTLIVMESTANGTGNFFYDEYQAALSGKSQFMPLFIPWFEIEQYTCDFESEDSRRQFAQSLIEGKESGEAKNGREQPGSYLWWLWQQGATLEGINWYIAERAKYSDHGQMASEYPSDDVEAFVHSGARVFDKYKVEALRPGCKEIAAKIGEVCGDAPSGSGSLENLRFVTDSQGLLKVWRLPEEESETRVNNRYLTVVDIGGRSSKADWSVVCVFDRLPAGTGAVPEVVAQWRGHTDFDLLAWNAARIAKFYDNSLLVIESNTLETHDRERSVEGDQSNYLLNRLRESYDNLYARRGRPEDIREGRPVKYGFHTNVATKPLIITNLVQVVREGLYVERDEDCLSEYLTYEQRQDGSYAALSGKHDDLLMTRAIGLHISLNEMDPPRRVLKTQDQGSYYPSSRGSYAVF